MKVAFFCPNKPLNHPHPSGDLVIAKGIQKALRGLGHDCREVVRFRSRWFWREARNWLDASISFWNAYREVRRFQPHVWLTYHTYYKCPDIFGPGMSRLLGIPYVLFQPMYATGRKKDPKTRAGFYLNRLAIEASHHVFTNNRNDMEALTRVLPSSRITYLPPGIFPEEFQYDKTSGRDVKARLGLPAESPVIVTAARFRDGVKFQSLTYLIKSLALLRTDYSQFTLLIVGDGPMEEEIRALAREIMPGQVYFSGGVDRADMAAHYSAGDIFVFPGIGESLGMVYLEAQSCGIPVVALDTAGARQVMEAGETGILVPDDGGGAMACAVRRLLESPEMRKTLGAGGYRFVRESRNLRLNYLEFSRVMGEIVRSYPAAYAPHGQLNSQS